MGICGTQIDKEKRKNSSSIESFKIEEMKNSSNTEDFKKEKRNSSNTQAFKKKKRKNTSYINAFKKGPGLGDIHNEPNEIEKIEQTKISKNTLIYEKDTGNDKMIPIDIIDKLKKSFCKISYNKQNNGTGFFISLNNSFKYIMTNYNLISENLINNIINIQLYNNRNINIKLYNRDMKFYNNLDITIIEIKESDGIIEDIDFLDYDLNYIKGYEQYLNMDIFTLQYLRNKGIYIAIGNIKDIFNIYEFIHNLNTEKVSSGSPIILFDSLKVIGIHKGGDKNKKINYGSFIGEIINEIEYLKENNYIIGEIYISEEDIGKNIRIINSYEEICRNYLVEIKEEKHKNEKEIKECKIEINDEKIPFCYYYKSEKKGRYKIKYIFDKYLTNINFMFSYCSSLTDLNLSNFNTQNIINMSSILSHCSSLTNLDLSNFNTQNVCDMSSMFSDCSSLTNLDLSNFNTQNVSDMSSMFSDCYSLINLDLSNFNTQNVTNMSYMFSGL